MNDYNSRRLERVVEEENMNEEVMESTVEKPEKKPKLIEPKALTNDQSEMDLITEDPNYVDLCPWTSRKHCRQQQIECKKVHYRPDIRPHTDLGLGDCSYLNTCHRMDTCRYLHWMVEDPVSIEKSMNSPPRQVAKQNLVPAQWVNCDLRILDVGILGQFDVVMMDPPWDIHMSLPYGTMTDDEMLKMPIAQLQRDGGLVFVWVTGRALELGRDCMRTWGYERIEEIVWVKTNQLQRLIRTGRTGHYLNHSKEHCLVGFKRPLNRAEGTMTAEEVQNALSWVQRGIDTDVIVAEVRETSRKPDEIYQMIERACPGGRKLELFGRQHNFRPGWITLGNQLSSDCLYEQETVSRQEFEMYDDYKDCGKCLRQHLSITYRR